MCSLLGGFLRGPADPLCALKMLDRRRKPNPQILQTSEATHALNTSPGPCVSRIFRSGQDSGLTRPIGFSIPRIPDLFGCKTLKCLKHPNRMRGS